ncbi:MAG: DUF3787 domain-containing protein [Andreesenia angusta]|nr:DUF3787 domain-containing protein [Andreesenia angusta]
MSEDKNKKNDKVESKVEKEKKDPEKLQKEDQSTAAWADVKCTTEDANVPIPSDDAVEDALEWINENKM